MDRDFIWKNIWLERGEEPLYGEDQMFVTYPCTFPVVSFALVSTLGLYGLADKIREEAGYKPVFSADGDYNFDGWYNFYVGINGDPINATDNCISFILCNSDQEDCEIEYHIDLTEQERLLLWDRLDEQARECYGKNCKELLQEAAETIDTAAPSGKW